MAENFVPVVDSSAHYRLREHVSQRRFFVRRFFVLRENVVLTSGGSGEECRVGDLPELDRGGHGPATAIVPSAQAFFSVMRTNPLGRSSTRSCATGGRST
jgi:hypothetical protein